MFLILLRPNNGADMMWNKIAMVIGVFTVSGVMALTFALIVSGIIMGILYPLTIFIISGKFSYVEQPYKEGLMDRFFYSLLGIWFSRICYDYIRRVTKKPKKKTK